ncbi:MAG: type III restriction-modification system endonuclease [Spirochaetia bacterium]|nr:type III restriction-modification system endonuclease [Spirochaetia bacterium]
MAGFHFEKNLQHQTRAVESTVSVFENIDIIQPAGIEKLCVNPLFEISTNTTYARNILNIQQLSGIAPSIKRESNIIDIMMETGTGKTYTYTKTIFEMNRQFGIFKFIIIVPTLSIKAGTIDFLKSENAREHFKEQYHKTLQLHIVESQKNNKSKKSFIPSAIANFVNSGSFEKNSIQVLLINAGMINSETLQKSFDTGLFDKYTVPFEAIKAVKPVVIIDEPHKFSQANKTWENIQKINPQIIFRYGATFPEYANLVYTLNAVDSFNNNLVKGVIGHITEFEAGQNSLVKLVNTDGTEATFELSENGKKKKVELAKNSSFSQLHSEMAGLTIENLNKTTVVLSNGLELKKGDKINPYSYAQTLQETMMQKAVKNHFELEKELLTREVKIKPLTLFFIDNIDEYRNEDGYIKKNIEKLVESEIKKLLKTETNLFYKAYLEKTLKDISLTHAGYFSRDNSEKDEAIEQEVNEILHDKQAMLDLENPRRFIFSKWTLREGWDNPNVFQICKLRSSGSDISKLQEVGRGLRLPVNEYGNRVKDEQFYLNYYVDFTESDFVDRLVAEINEKSAAISIDDAPEELNENMIQKICEVYKTSNEELLETLDQNSVITRSNKFKPGGFDFIKTNFPLIFQGVGSNKIRKATQSKTKVHIRTEKYHELKELWEKLNQKVILEYKFEKEENFIALFTEFIKAQKNNFNIDGLKERKAQIEIQNNQAVVKESESIYSTGITPVVTMQYSTFIEDLAHALKINMKTVHQAIVDSGIAINNYLNNSTIRILKQNFNDFLMYNAIDKFSIEYKKVTNAIHPTTFTNKSGGVLSEVSSSDVGVMYSKENVANAYFLDELFYDSELERENIRTNIEEVVVFTKIPKNSIKIPVAGGKSYSPDFAYVLNLKDGKKKLHFIVETKNVAGDDILRKEEIQKLKHAEKFFGENVKIFFKTQFSNDKIGAMIRSITEGR